LGEAVREHDAGTASALCAVKSKGHCR
jgi:hypothetical protein